MSQVARYYMKHAYKIVFMENLVFLQYGIFYSHAEHVSLKFTNI